MNIIENMKRKVSFEEISDGKRYCCEDLVKVSCGDCNGCSECCKFTDDTIHLDPYDIYELSKETSLSFDRMLTTTIDLTVVDGIITPYLKKSSDSGACVFLSSQGRCLIHGSRPGYCRLFPLGRIYNDDGSFDYFIQVHECPYPSKSKIKVKRWLGVEKLSSYEQFVSKWHLITKEASLMAIKNPELSKDISMKLLNTFFLKPFDAQNDFYEQFSERLSAYYSMN